MQVTTISGFRANIKQYYDNVLLTEEPLIITKGDTGAILIPLEQYVLYSNSDKGSYPLYLRFVISPGETKTRVDLNDDYVLARFHNPDVSGGHASNTYAANVAYLTFSNVGVYSYTYDKNTYAANVASK